MGERDFARENRIATTNNGTGGTTVVWLTKRSFLGDLVEFGGETVNFVN